MGVMGRFKNSLLQQQFPHYANRSVFKKAFSAVLPRERQSHDKIQPISRQHSPPELALANDEHEVLSI